MPKPLVAVLAVIGGLVAVGIVGAIVFAALAPHGSDLGDALPDAEPHRPAPAWVPPAAPPLVASTPTGPGLAGAVDPTWLESTASATGIPQNALAAYAGVALAKTAAMPECGISWNLLAAIGHAESDHGRHGGSSVGDDGLVTPPIFGAALAGGDVENIPDSDGGALDGDAEYDRAMGPMQLIPQTWRNWHVDGSGDGVEDPQNMDDAVYAAANYLCRGATALGTESGWNAAVASYNSNAEYRDRVARAAQAYLDATG